MTIPRVRAAAASGGCCRRGGGGGCPAWLAECPSPMSSGSLKAEDLCQRPVRNRGLASDATGFRRVLKPETRQVDPQRALRLFYVERIGIQQPTWAHPWRFVSRSHSGHVSAHEPLLLAAQDSLVANFSAQAEGDTPRHRRNARGMCSAAKKPASFWTTVRGASPRWSSDAAGLPRNRSRHCAGLMPISSESRRENSSHSSRLARPVTRPSCRMSA